jgi:hypothetical protein
VFFELRVEPVRSMSKLVFLDDPVQTQFRVACSLGQWDIFMCGFVDDSIFESILEFFSTQNLLKFCQDVGTYYNLSKIIKGPTHYQKL